MAKRGQGAVRRNMVGENYGEFNHCCRESFRKENKWSQNEKPATLALKTLLG